MYIQVIPLTTLAKSRQSLLGKQALNTKLFFLLTSLSMSGCVAPLSLPQDFQKVSQNYHIPAKPLAAALKAYRHANSAGQAQKHVVTLIDYSQPSNARRLYTLDLEQHKLLYHDYVSHGEGSGAPITATLFSNRPESYASSLGVYRTAQSYYGTYGYSLILQGLEPGFNDQAAARHIVLHGASYSTPAFVKKFGFAGLSLGCPAVDEKIIHPLIDTIKEGSLVVIYYPDYRWLGQSKFLS